MPAASTSMVGKVCLVTGATDGLGKATALQLARLGAEVVIVGRNEARIGDALADIRTQSGNPRVHGLRADLSLLAEVCRVAEQFRRRHQRLDVLVNNVGATFLRYEETRENLEKTWALNYLGHFLLTNSLLDLLQATAQAHDEARVVELTSSIYRFSSPDFTKRQRAWGYNGALAYAHTKRAINVFSTELARRTRGSGVTINAITPKFVATRIAQRSQWWADFLMFFIRRFSLPLEEGVKPIVHLAAAPERKGISGQYFVRYDYMPLDPSVASPSAGQALWALSEEQIGQRRAIPELKL